MYIYTICIHISSQRERGREREREHTSSANSTGSLLVAIQRMLLRQPLGGHELKEIRNTLATLREHIINTYTTNAPSSATRWS